MKENKPLYEHNCDKCQFLGSFRVRVTEKYDLYYCYLPQYGCNLIARASSNPDDYISDFMLAMQERNLPLSPLGEAWRRAKSKNLSLLACGGLAPEEEPIIDTRPHKIKTGK